MTGTGSPATLIFDGDCGICRVWVRYWEQLTGGRVVYRAYQEAAADFPGIPVSAFERAIQFVEPDGRVYAGAAATYRVLAHAQGRGFWWWMYAHVPGFGPVSELAYDFFARRRGLLAAVTRLLWGPTLAPERYDAVSWVFLRLLGLIYLAAFASLAVQIEGLVGEHGILPAGEYLAAAREAWGSSAYWQLPTVFWLGAGDTILWLASLAGIAAATLLTAGLWIRPALVGLFALYLSFVYAGQIFFNYQWDLLLLESGFLAIFLTGGSRIVVWLYRWLVFRYLFMAGAVKLLSGDPTWRALTALDYHFWTQPLPTPLAWYAGRLPEAVLMAMTAAVLAIELAVAFLAFLPRRLRAFAAWCVLAFQLIIVLTGNYNFFNLLTMALCVFLFDDAALERILPRGLVRWIGSHTPRPGRMATAAAAALALVVVPAGLDLLWQPISGRSLPIAGAVGEWIQPLRIVNGYGLFATMTTERPEIVLEGSDDGRTWREYVFRYKPGPVERRPSWNIPHQPRLDWQMWFAAYGSLGEHRWIERLMRALIEGRAPVVGLLAATPFPDHPPKYVRAELYSYRFAPPASAQWWERQLMGMYVPQLSRESFPDVPRS